MLLLALAIVPLAAQGPRRASLILSGGIVITMDGGHRVLRPGAVAIEGSDIAAVGSPAEIAEGYTGEVIDTTGDIVLPGLVNTHGHAPMVRRSATS